MQDRERKGALNVQSSPCRPGRRRCTSASLSLLTVAIVGTASFGAAAQTTAGSVVVDTLGPAPAATVGPPTPGPGAGAGPGAGPSLLPGGGPSFAGVPRGPIIPGTVPSGTPAPSRPKVNEEPPPPLPAPRHTVAGWQALWSDLSKGAVDLRVALSDIERAEAATRVAWGAIYPRLTGTVTLSFAPTSGAGQAFALVGGRLQGQLSLAATLINVRAFHQIGTQHLLEEVAALSVADVRRRLGENLARAAVSIAAARRLADGNRTALELSLQRLELTRRRRAVGFGDDRDLVRALQDVAQARSVIAANDEDYVQAQEGLGSLLGVSGGASVGVEMEALEAQVRAFCGDGLPRAAGPRIDVVIARKQIEVARRNVDDIVYKFVPTLTGTASVGAIGPAFDGPYDPGWNLAQVLTIPFYDGGVRYGEKRDRVAAVQQQVARAEQAEVLSNVEVAQARRAIDVALAAQESAREARDLAVEAERLAKLAYAMGIGTNFELVDAGRQLRQAETTLVLRDLDVARARVTLPFLAGGCRAIEQNQPVRGDPR